MIPTSTTSPSKETSRRAAVYRLYNEAGALLYIGSAYDPDHRCKSHHVKPWWPQVAQRVDEWHPSREAAYVAETEAIATERPGRNRISGPGPVRLPVPGAANPIFALTEIDAYLDALHGEPPEARAKRLTELLKSVGEKVRRERRAAVLEMQAGGMTYRQIADASGISFGRVRQIIADDPADSPDPAEE
ncbi:hypothetical protein [Actinacidiphila sp. ITFR-21]|uniref:hypothetical protein n=1 Tax=Actinacidiphila sp. ITFR-21 TaxID=3075199 RepID=UPI00288C1A96|nr:hypothetical protein [Streptomyces sp. ITFR-21]WNI19200.1 hypothetical protein RLT57_29095 [Streptomyces sp. ITFR-21]